MKRLLLIVLLIAGTVIPLAATAEMLDLTGRGSSGEINGAWFLQQDPYSGSGLVTPFLSIGREGIEQGYNTDSRRMQFDEKKGALTHSLLLADVPVVTIKGGEYREFLLNISEPETSPQNLLSLDRLQIFMAGRGDIHGYAYAFPDPIYDLDFETDNWMKLDANLNAGCATGDMFAYIPNSLFEDAGQYVYLYSKFGEQGSANNGLGASLGTEDWAVRKGNFSTPPPSVPEPASVALALMGMMPMAAIRLKRRG